MDKYDRWIEKKLNSGVNVNELRECVVAFSNKSKKRIMQEKGLNERQYKQRYDFLSKVF